MIKKVTLSILITTGLFANTFAEVDCTEMNKIFNMMNDITKVCQVDTNIHTFKQEISENVAGIIEYDDGLEIPFITTNNIFHVNIQADRPFIFKVGNFRSARFKLSLLKDGSESWKYFYIPTKRWRNYDFKKVSIETVDVISRIIHADKTPFVNVIVQLITDTTIYESITDSNGTFRTFMNIDTPFRIQAFNYEATPNIWSTYDNQFKISKDGDSYEFVNNIWTESSERFDSAKTIK